MYVAKLCTDSSLECLPISSPAQSTIKRANNLTVKIGVLYVFRFTPEKLMTAAPSPINSHLQTQIALDLSKSVPKLSGKGNGSLLKLLPLFKIKRSNKPIKKTLTACS